MEWMQVAVQFGLLILGTVAVIATMCIGLPIWLHHRRHMLKMKQNGANELQALQSRIDKLEARCSTLQEQVTEAHLLLADERRELDQRLDKRLSQIGPDPLPDAEENERTRPSGKRVTGSRLHLSPIIFGQHCKFSPDSSLNWQRDGSARSRALCTSAAS